MNKRSILQASASVGAVAIAASLLLAPAAAAVVDAPVAETSVVNTQVRPAESIAACEVSDATLTWGTIERWRSYIQGSIAHGGWSEEGNVTYEVPNFVWSEGAGIVALDGVSGTVSFDGTVHFSGHDDLLRVDAGNPTLEIVDAEEAYLLLDLSSTKTDGTEDISGTQVRAVALDIVGTATSGAETLTFTDVAGDLTAEGAAAFGGFYSAGEAVDPLTIEMTAADGCTFAVATGAETDGQPETDAPPSSDEPAADDAPAAEPLQSPDMQTQTPWLPIIVGGVAVVVIVGAAMMLISGRKKNTDATNTDEV